jgi:hypothetical protein
MKTMDYEQILSNYNDPTVGSAVLNALNRLFEKDNHLLDVNCSEKSITAKLAQYLSQEPYFKQNDVDVEYNRQGNDPKSLNLNGTTGKVFPDIIIHSRGNNENNVLAIELKKDSSKIAKDEDIEKLKAYKNELRYAHALFIRLGTKNKAGKVLDCEWI